MDVKMSRGKRRMEELREEDNADVEGLVFYLFSGQMYALVTASVRFTGHYLAFGW